MRSLGRPFNHPSVEALIVEIYKIVQPIDDATPTGTVLNGTEIVFVDPVDPVGHSLNIQWSLDGGELVGQTGTTLDLAALSLSQGSYLLSVTVADNTPLVRNEADRDVWMTQSLNWTVEVPVGPGDVNCDNVVDLADVSAMVLALIDPMAYLDAYPLCSLSRADINGDGFADGADLQGFTHALVP
jgi:hypothetical protein